MAGTYESGIAAVHASFLREGLVLAVRVDDELVALDACRAARRGGLTILELTLTTPGALRTIRTLADEGGALVGAGTVLTPDEVAAVADAGGQFALSPVFHPEVLDEAERHGLLAIPGASTPGEILAAHRHGARLVKVFPSGPLGGPDYLRKVRGPLPNIPLMPTSGPTAENLHEYLAAGAVALGVGQDVLTPGFTPESVESAAKRLRNAFEAAKAGQG